MNAHLAPDRVAVPPSAAWNGRVPVVRRPARVPSATAFVSTVIFTAIAIVMAATLIAIGPQTVTIPLAVVLIAGLAASALVVAGDRWLARRRRGGGERHSVSGRTNGRRPALPAHDARRRDAAADEAGWGALGALSMTLLVLALAVPEGLRIPLAAIGLAGLVVLRVAAMYGGRIPRGSVSH